ncbi:MAG TPA: 2-dehydropantoate 2-reductase [Xanthomonadales bacterium]|nr:2-dehydropantoate 2-reductase [Xanthomonadales bacterium]
MSAGGRPIVVYGAGAIGATVGGWLVAAGIPVTVVVRPARARILNDQGLWLYQLGNEAARRRIPVHAVSELSEVEDAETVLLAVKNYDLDQAAREIKAGLKRQPVIVALQNGIDNQSILPSYFSKVVYGVIQYNAWRDADNVFGFQVPGPVVLGVLDKSLVAERNELAGLFAKAFRCGTEERIADAARCKMLFNLAGSITTLVGLGVREIDDIGALRQSVSHVFYEAMQILMAAGVREVRLARGGNWMTIRAMRFLPGWVTNRSFRKKLENVRMSSMVQDVYVMKRGSTELESLNGYFIRLADSVGLDAPYNRALYRIAKNWLGQADRRPMDETDLWARLQAG